MCRAKRPDRCVQSRPIKRIYTSTFIRLRVHRENFDQPFLYTLSARSLSLFLSLSVSVFISLYHSDKSLIREFNSTLPLVGHITAKSRPPCIPPLSLSLCSFDSRSLSICPTWIIEWKLKKKEDERLIGRIKALFLRLFRWSSSSFHHVSPLCHAIYFYWLDSIGEGMGDFSQKRINNGRYFSLSEIGKILNE